MHNFEDHKHLVLKVEDEAELGLISAHFQDAMVPYTLIHFDPKKLQLRLLCNRFCWEKGGMKAGGRHVYHRIHSVLFVPDVQKLEYRGFQQFKPTHVFTVLSIAPIKDPTKTRFKASTGIVIKFAGGGEIRVTQAALKLYMRDLHEPWSTDVKPAHFWDEVA